MPGRVEIDDVAPVVSCGAYPAKAVVGEVVPVRATVWREGHRRGCSDAGGALSRPALSASGRNPAAQSGAGPALAEAAAEPLPRVKPLLLPMSMGEEPYVFHGQFTPDSVGLWTFRVDGWGDPIHTWRHAIEAKLEAGQGESELSNDLLVGAQLLERAATGVPRSSARTVARRRGRPASAGRSGFPGRAGADPRSRRTPDAVSAA